MASIPLVALGAHAPEQPDLLQKYGQLQQLRGMQQQSQMQQQEAPLRMQALQQGVQQGQMQNEQMQQQQQDQQAFRKALQDPSLQGKTVGEVADALAHQGQISQAGWVAAKKSDLETRSTLAKLDETALANQKSAHAATAELYNNVMNMPDDQLAANWPQIAQQYDAIPGNQKQPLDPNKPLTKQQLAQFGPVISLGNSYFDQELARREAQAKAKTAEQTAEAGGTSDLAKYQQDYIKANNLENTPANRQKAFAQYTKETKLDPAAVRAQVFMQMPQAVFNPDTGQNEFTTRKNAIGQVAPNSAEALAAKAGIQADAASLKKLQSTYDMTHAFEQTAEKNMDLLQQTAKSIPDLGSRAANIPVRMISASMIGAENMARFKTALTTAQTEAAKVLNNPGSSGVLSDSARHELQDVIDGNMPYKSLVGTLDTLKKDMSNRNAAYQQQIKDVQDRIKGGNQPQQPTTADPLGIR